MHALDLVARHLPQKLTQRHPARPLPLRRAQLEPRARCPTEQACKGRLLGRRHGAVRTVRAGDRVYRERLIAKDILGLDERLLFEGEVRRLALLGHLACRALAYDGLHREARSPSKVLSGNQVISGNQR